MWFFAASVLLVGLIPCGIVAMRGELEDAVTGLETSTVLVASALLMLAVGSGRSVYADVALLVAALSFAGGMVFVRALEDWR